MIEHAGMLTLDGRCKTLDAFADGYVRGESCVLIVLEAIGREDSHKPAVLLGGSSVNQDGRSSSLTAPSGRAQQTVMRAALANGGTAAQHISKLELHGTGTALGDPIEFGAAVEVLQVGFAVACVRVCVRRTHRGYCCVW